MKSFKTLMTKTQKYAETWEEYYKVLQIKNKYLLAKLQKTKKLTKINDVDHSEESKNRTFLNEINHFRKSYVLIEGNL